MAIHQVWGKNLQESSARLRSILEQAQDGDVIQLGSGLECQGPFEIRTRVRIEGTGNAAGAQVLFARHEPVVMVCVEGVVLQNIALHSLNGAEGVALLTFPQTRPELINLDILGRQETLQPQQVIDLGVFPPQTTTSIPLEITVTEPTTLSLTLPSGEITPNILPASGRHWVTLAIKTENQPLLGQLHLKSEQTSRSLWVRAAVQPAPPTLSGRLQLRTPKHVFFSSQQISLTPYDLSPAIPLGAFANPVGVIYRESSGLWALYRTSEKASPFQLNMQQVETWGRFVLKKGDRLLIANTEMVVEEVPSHLLVSESPELDFGTIRQGEQTTARLTLKNPHHMMPWEGRVEVSSLWLQTRTPKIRLEPTSSGNVDFTIDTSLQIPPAHQVWHHPVLLRNEKQTLSVPLRFQS